jgi:parvulin-like peptidyl-prolyl isomerase
MPGVAATVDGKSITMRYLSEECIARYGIEILETEITLLLLRQALQKQGLSVSDQDVTAEIMRAANSFGFAKDGKIDMNAWLDYITQGDQSKIAFYIEDEVWPTVALKKIVGPTVQVTQEDMRKGFIANFGERVEVQAIILHDIKLAKKVWQQATADPSEKFFGQLAAEYSMDVASKNNKGHINPIPQYGGIPELEKEAFRLKKPGDISAIIQVGQNFAILRYLGRTKPVVQDFDAVKADLQADILEKKTRVAMNDYFGRLRSSAQIDNFMTGTSQTGRQAVGDSRQPQAGQPRLK